MAFGQLVTNEMAVRLLFEKEKVVGVETIPSPTPKRGFLLEIIIRCWVCRGGGFHSESSGRTEKHFARSEVILCAGA